MKTILTTASSILFGLGLVTTARADEPSVFSLTQPGEEVISTPPNAGPLQFGGYFRSGAGTSSKGVAVMIRSAAAVGTTGWWAATATTPSWARQASAPSPEVLATTV